MEGRAEDDPRGPHGVVQAGVDPLWESFKETADVPKWFGRDLYGELGADTLALAAAYGWNDQRVRARLHDAVRAAAKEN